MENKFDFKEEICFDLFEKPLEGYGFIYKITCNTTKESYIGQTVKSINSRWNRHKKRKRECLKINRAIKKYGENNFTLYKLGIFPKDSLNNAEIEAIKIFKTLSPDGYNLTEGGKSGGSLSEETKAKLAKYCGAKSSFYGKKHSPESIEKMRLYRTGKAVSKETAEKISKIKKGIPVSEETRLKMSLAKLGKKTGRNYKIADKTIFIFRNVNTGEVYEGLRIDFCKKFNIFGQSVGSLLRLKLKQTSGWIIDFEGMDSMNGGGI